MASNYIYQFPVRGIRCCTYSKCISANNSDSSSVRVLHTPRRPCSLFYLLELWLPVQVGSSDVLQLWTGSDPAERAGVIKSGEKCRPGPLSLRSCN